MGDEGAEVAGDQVGGLADAHACAVLVDHPEAEDGVAVVEGGFGGQGLADLRAGVGAAGRVDRGAIADDGDVGALAGVEGFADVIRHCARGGEVGFEE